ncbi:MAG: septation regulator SpoVG [Bacilli bacterium]|nr:septation regulator SpoVG [Bacilli bacterium]
MKVTDVKIKLREDDSKIKAVAAVTFDDCFVVHGINVIEGQKGMFIAMPSRKISETVYLDIVHPTNSETRKMIEEAIFAAMDQVE